MASVASATSITETVPAGGAKPASPTALPIVVKRSASWTGTATARGAETEVRLTLRTREEQLRAITERATGLERAAADELAARERWAARAARRSREREVAGAVSVGAAYAVTVVSRAADLAQARRDELEGERAAREVALAEVRRELSGLQEQQRELTDSVHRDELARAQQRLRIETLEARAVEELDHTRRDFGRARRRVLDGVRERGKAAVVVEHRRVGVGLNGELRSFPVP